MDEYLGVLLMRNNDHLACQQFSPYMKQKSTPMIHFNLIAMIRSILITYVLGFNFSSRLAKAFEELENFLKTEANLSEIQEYKTALTVLEEARPQLP